MAPSTEDIAAFAGITGTSDEVARHMLEFSGGDVMQAVQLWFSDEELQRAMTASAAASASTSTAAPAAAASSSRPNRRALGREDADGVIHLDSDDDTQMTEDDDFGRFDNDDDDREIAQAVARTAQEEEDAAMAKRLQEEMYGANAEDSIRAPLSRRTETLVGGYGDDDDGHEAVLAEMRRRAQAPAARARNHNPFSQSVWDEAVTVGSASGVPSRPTGPTSRAARLADLFRPPYDLIARLAWDEARDLGKEDKKWILVNLQDMSDFNCQTLNRDHWKDEAIKALVQEHFIFLQFDKGDPSAEQYISFYLPGQSHENPNNYPHVSIVDPRTGEQVKVWSGLPFPTPLEFHAQLAEFLDRYSLAANSKNPVPKKKRPERTVNVDRMTEEEMLELALQNSLTNNGGHGTPDLHDPDALTKSISDLTEGEGKGKEKAQDEGDALTPVAEPEAVAPSPFASIPSDRPHVEPAADPKTTTRIQVRNPPSRIIRRFNLEDPVSRIYEWLKAEPLPGKEGVEFELKTVPQGENLIDHLDLSIKDAKLANATIMVEFVEE